MVRFQSIRTLLLLLLGTSAGACQRPFVDLDVPDLFLVEPDLSVIQVEPDIMLRVRASSSFRTVSRVDVGSTPMSYNQAENFWEAMVTLDTGLNTLVIKAFDEEGVPGQDTVHAFHMPFSFQPFPTPMPVPIGGHTATIYPFGDLVITGGTSTTVEGFATDAAWILQGGTTNMIRLPEDMLFARAGHTATLLDDGRLLILGGGTTGSVDIVEELVEAVEIFDHASRSFTEIPVMGDPIRRMLHTAAYRITSQGTVIDILGGTGDVQYVPEPRLGTRRDLRSFLLQNDTLFALSPAIGPTVEPVSGHTQTSVRRLAPGEEGEYLVTGEHSGDLEGATNFLIDFAAPEGISVNSVQSFRFRRTRHASERLKHELIGVFGGILPDQSDLVPTPEVYLKQFDRTFVFPTHLSSSSTLRYGHTATSVGPNRILFIGGFNASGAAMKRIDLFGYTL